MKEWFGVEDYRRLFICPITAKDLIPAVETRKISSLDIRMGVRSMAFGLEIAEQVRQDWQV